MSSNFYSYVIIILPPQPDTVSEAILDYANESSAEIASPPQSKPAGYSALNGCSRTLNFLSRDLNANIEVMILKKLISAPFFLISFVFLVYQLSPLIKSSDFIFSLSGESLIQFLITCSLLSLSSFLFILFATLASDWKLVLPVALLASLSPFLFLEAGLAIVASVMIFVALLLTTLNLESILKSYLTFNANSLLGPAIRHLAGLLILSISIVYFLSANKVIAQNGFQIPDSLIDTALNFTQLESSQQLDAPQNLANDLIKQTVKDQIQNLIKPYAAFIPAALAILLFFTLQSLTSLINLLIYPLLWITFYILEKSSFIKFEVEMREVKKLVV